MTLKYAPFASCKQLQLAARNVPPLRLSSHGVGVGLLQAGLVQSGFALPRSMRNGKPDSVFGPETFAAVKAFQLKHGLKDDGVAGHYTLVKLDGLLTAAAAPPVPSPLPVIPAPSTPEYELGTADPTIKPDPGAGAWNSRPTEVTYVALKAAILNVIPTATVTVGPHAAAHMLHYLANTGRVYRVDLESMVRDVPSAKRRYEDEVAQLQRFVELLATGQHQFTSRRINNGYNKQSESTNWYFAIGGYSSWGKGTVKVEAGASGKTYTADYEYKFFDRYNWDAGKSVTLAGITITDHFMGEFHRQGLAREFDCVGSFKRRFSWKQGQAIPPAQVHEAGGRAA